MEFKVTLSDTERGVDFEGSVVLARHPSETQEHLVLRALAWCLWHTEGIEPGPGLCDGDAADVLAKDATGRTTLWIECGSTTWEKLRRVARQNSGARVVAFFDSAKRRAAVVADIEAEPKPPKERAAIDLVLVDEALVRALAADESRRHRWTVTVVTGHVYIEADGKTFEGALER
jgi:uncharacterized protein YaeQ